MSDHAREVSLRSIFVVDDDEDVRIALEALLTSLEYDVLTFASAEEFLESKYVTGPGCLVLDVRLGGKSGIALQSHLTRIGSTLPIVFISGHGDIPMAVAAIKSGAMEFLTKPIRSQELVRAIELALARAVELKDATERGASMVALFSRLTPRERDVMKLVVAGHGNKSAARTLGISEPTVKAHRGQVMRKMEVTTLPDLVRVAEIIKDLN